MTVESFARPASLREVAAQGALQADGVTLDHRLREFLDAFYAADAPARARAIANEPASVGRVADAYLAAVAEHLARRFNLDIPAWTGETARFLREPYFAGGYESLKAILLVESPTAFRRRNIFVSHDARARARDPGIARDPRYRAREA